MNQAPAIAASIRPATSSDAVTLLDLVKEFADFAGELDDVTATEESVADSLFNEAPSVFAHLVEVDVDGTKTAVGYAVWYITFSTWLGRRGAWIEDLYIRPEYRNHGLGGQLLDSVKAICRERGYGRLEWVVHNWNTEAVKFYRRQHAHPKAEFTIYRIDGVALSGAPAEVIDLTAP